MSRTVFIDTSGFYALLVQSDAKHPKAVKILHQASKDKQSFVTSDYVLDETATLLLSRGLAHLVPGVFDAVFASSACSVAWMDQERFLKTRAFFLKYAEHAWSFTDCASFIIMKEMKLSSALTTDRHFQEAGFTSLLL
jgi:predicted nucleic acid-binding protein